MNFQIFSPIILFLFSLYGILVGVETIQKQKQIGAISIGLSLFTIVLLFHLYCSFKGGLHKNLRIIITTIALSLALFSFFALFGSYCCQLLSVSRYI